MTAISVGLIIIGIVLLSMSLKRHYLQIFPNHAGFSYWCRPCLVGGYALLFVAMIVCITSVGIGVGLVLWFSIVATAALLQAALLSFWARFCWLFACFGLLLINAGLLA